MHLLYFILEEVFLSSLNYFKKIPPKSTKVSKLRAKGYKIFPFLFVNSFFAFFNAYSMNFYTFLIELGKFAYKHGEAGLG